MGDPFEGLFDSGDVLERVGVDLTSQARRGDLEPVRCRDPEIARAVDILLRQSKNNPALIGRAGVGKTAIVEGLAQRVAAGNVPPALKDARGLERHHAVALTDDALKAAIVLTDRFVPERARPDKAIDVVDEACAHAQATARVSPELDRLIRERRKVDAMIRRGLTTAPGVAEPAPDLAAVIDQVVADFREMLGGQPASRTGGQGAPGAPEPTDRPPARPPDRPLEERRTELDSLLRAELESQGIVVTGREVARVVSAAVGKGIEWAG